MKKLLFLVFGAIFISNSSFAQKDSSSSVISDDRESYRSPVVTNDGDGDEYNSYSISQSAPMGQSKRQVSDTLRKNSFFFLLSSFISSHMRNENLLLSTELRSTMNKHGGKGEEVIEIYFYSPIVGVGTTYAKKDATADEIFEAIEMKVALMPIKYHPQRRKYYLPEHDDNYYPHTGGYPVGR